jgi:uncharacterized protein (AIM24 family)
LRLDTGCLVAFEPRVTYDIQWVGGLKSALFGGEGLFFATLTGLGLFIVSGLVRELKGQVRAYSHDDRPGTCFRIELPIAREAS